MLLTYPLVIAVLVGLVAGYANTKPRVALVDLDHLPQTIAVGGHVFHVDATIDEIARNVKLVRVRTRIAVDLSQRRLTYYRGGRVVMRVRVGIGSPATPTPVGRFYVNQSFREDPTGPYGPAAIGISAYSTVLTWWPQGGPVAIHGTDRPWTIGRAASNGCIHVPNGVARRLFRITPAGTPVRITA